MGSDSDVLRQLRALSVGQLSLDEFEDWLLAIDDPLGELGRAAERVLVESAGNVGEDRAVALLVRLLVARTVRVISTATSSAAIMQPWSTATSAGVTEEGSMTSPFVERAEALV